VLERGAVEGEVFHRGAVQALTPEEPEVTPRLASLVRRELIRSERAQFVGEDGFRFRHLLIRDAAYEALPKARRAELHTRFADWLEQRGGLVELDEILGYHLEQAARYRQELGQGDASLAERAGSRLAAAGRSALWRGDSRAAAGLLERSLALTRPHRLDVMLEIDLANAYTVRDAPKAAAIAGAAAERARASADVIGELLARVSGDYHRSQFDADPDFVELEHLARTVLPLLEQEENYAGLNYIWEAFGLIANFDCRHEDGTHAAEQALRYGRLSGRRDMNLFGVGAWLARGPRPADEALRTLDELLPENPHPQQLLCRAELLTMLARFDEANQIAREAGDRLRDLTGDDTADDSLAAIAETAGRHDDAVVHLRRFCKLLEARGLRNNLSSYAPALGRSLCALGRYEEAEPLAQLGRELGAEQDTIAQCLWRQVQALVDAHHGQFSDAEQLAREAVALTERTDALTWQGDALCDLAEVLDAAGKQDEAEATFAEALKRFERKRNLAQAAQVRERMTVFRRDAAI
jgi:tetratricopeptide (TPR) repeat protein